MAHIRRSGRRRRSIVWRPTRSSCHAAVHVIQAPSKFQRARQVSLYIKWTFTPKMTRGACHAAVRVIQAPSKFQRARQVSFYIKGTFSRKMTCGYQKFLHAAGGRHPGSKHVPEGSPSKLIQYINRTFSRKMACRGLPEVLVTRRYASSRIQASSRG
jgi:hypothetical protein